jgi:serine/threonine protein kinase/formylglycine-generating enzyme required for sulfatase activity
MTLQVDGDTDDSLILFADEDALEELGGREGAEVEKDDEGRVNVSIGQLNAVSDDSLNLLHGEMQRLAEEVITGFDEESATLEAAEQIIGGKYRLGPRLGKGGFGSVFEATDEILDSRVAIKFVHTSGASERAFKMFHAEARRLTRLNHPNIVDWKVFERTDDGRWYLVMELIEGDELDLLLKREGRLQPYRVARILLQILDSLRAAHNLSETESILHLDLKPKNVFLTPGPAGEADERVKVIDFGIGQYVGGQEEEVGESDTVGPPPNEDSAPVASSDGIMSSLHSRRQGMTANSKDGSEVRLCKSCTPEYASPEQSAHMLPHSPVIALDGRSDLYSLGVMGFQLMTGQLPFDLPADRYAYLALHQSTPPKRVGSLARVPRDLGRFIDRCLVKDREQRWTDTNEAYHALHRIVHPPVKATIAKVVVPLVLVAGLLVFLVFQWADRQFAKEALALATEAGVQLGREYVGPSNESMLVKVPNSPLEPETRVQVLRRSDGSVVSGWQGAYDSPYYLRLTAQEPLDRPVEVVLEFVEGILTGRKSEPFTLVYLTDQSWSLGSVQIGSEAIDQFTDKTLDPRGLKLSVVVVADSVSDIHSVTAVSGSEETQLDFIKQDESGLHFEGKLEEMLKVEGQHFLNLRVTDALGRDRVEALPTPIEVVTASLRILDSSIRGVPKDAMGNYLLTRDLSPDLHVRVNRACRMVARLQLDSQPPIQIAQQSGSSQFFANFGGLLTNQSQPTNGTISIEVSESENRVALSDRPPIRDEISFRFGEGIPDVQLRFSSGRQGEALLSADRSTGLLDPGELNHVNGTQLDLALQISNNIPALVYLFTIATTGERIQVGKPTDWNGPNKTFHVPIALDGLSASPQDGIYWIEADCYYWYKGMDLPAPELVPTVRHSYPLHLDTSRCRLRWQIAGSRGEIVVRGDTELLPSLQASVVDDNVSELRTPVKVRWELRGTGRGFRGMEGAWTQADGVVELESQALWDHLTAVYVPDGTYQLAVVGQDEAGNPADEDVVEVVLAKTAPQLRLLHIYETELWRREANGRWRISVEAFDPNGVAEIKAQIRVLDDSTTSRDYQGPSPVPQRVSLVPSSSPDRFEGHLDFDHQWSERRVELIYEARDRHGNRQEGALNPKLPEILPKYSTGVTLALAQGLEVGDLILVRGNRVDEYSFCGRLSREEDKDHDRWQLTYSGPRADVRYTKGQISDFYLAKTEVSNSVFLHFVEEAGLLHWSTVRQQELLQVLRPADQDLPVAGISWPEARAFCQWLGFGCRLPSLVEWEYAVRGGTLYRPYAAHKEGQAHPTDIDVNYWSTGPWAVLEGSDCTVEGILHLGGNLEEWTATPSFAGSPWPPESSRENFYRRVAWKDYQPLALSPWSDGRCQQSEFFMIAGGYYRSGKLPRFNAVRSEQRDDRSATLGFRFAISGLELLDLELLSSGRLRVVKESSK